MIQVAEMTIARSLPVDTFHQAAAERLTTALDAVRCGEGAVIELTGEPGIGKTRLLSRLGEEATRLGVRVLSGRCTEAEHDLPFQSVRNALRLPPQQLPPTPPGARPQDDGDLLARYEEVRGALTAAAYDGGLLLVLDDFHWADDASVAALDHLLRWPVDAPLLVVAAQRPRQVSRAARGVFARGLATGAVRRIELTGLDPESAADLLGMPSTAPQLAELLLAADGNPLYLRAMAHAGPARWRDPVTGCAADVPEQIAALLLAEVAALAPAERRLLDAAAVLGQEFFIETAADVAELMPGQAYSALDGLTRRDLVRANSCGSAFTVRHPVLGRVLYTDTDPGWRALAHDRARRSLSRQGAGAVRLAGHIERSLVVRRADLPVLTRAAEDSMHTSPAAAVHWLRLALRVLPEEHEGDRRRLELMLLLARALGAMGKPGESRDLLHGILHLIPAETSNLRVSALSHCALMDCFLGNNIEAWAMLEQELASILADPTPEAAPLIIEHEVIGLVAKRAPDHDRLDLAIRLARDAGDRLTEAGAYALRAIRSALDGRLGPAEAAVESSAAILDSLSDRDLVPHLEHLGTLGWAELFLGRFTSAERHFTRGMAITYRTGPEVAFPALLSGLAMIYRFRGPSPGACRITEWAAAVADRMGAGDDVRGLTQVLAAAGTMWTDRDTSARVLAEAATALERATFGTCYWNATGAVALASVAAPGGDPRETVALLMRAGGTPALSELPCFLDLLRPLLFELLTDAGSRTGHPATPRWASRAADAALRMDLPHLRAFALLARAHGERRDDPAGAADSCARAAEDFGAAGLWLQQALALDRAAASATAGGDTVGAVRLLERARESARRCGAVVVEREVDRRLRLLRVPRPAAGPEIARATVPARQVERPRAAVQPLLGMLTRRETEVARAAGTGKKTREIAQELYLSPRTVDCHLTRIYRKLNIGSRAALVHLLAQSD